MMFEKFTDGARTVLMQSQGEVRELGHRAIDTHHVLLSIIILQQSGARVALEIQGVTRHSVYTEVMKLSGFSEVKPVGHIPVTKLTHQLLTLATRIAVELGHEHVDIDHLMLALIRQAEGPGYEVLVSLGVDIEKLRIDTHQAVLAGRPVTDVWRNRVAEIDQELKQGRSFVDNWPDREAALNAEREELIAKHQ
jgi:ATP-dependent Clp protease ATP-binding subunit ClpC